MKKISHFKRDIRRDLFYPGVSLFQMDLSSVVNLAIKKGGIEDEDFKKLPSWQKFAKSPVKAKSFYIHLLQALFEGKHSLDSLNMEYQLEDSRIIAREQKNKRKVSMIFFPHNTRVENLEKILDITKDTLPSYEVILLVGSDSKTSNANAERHVKEQLERHPDKNFLILASQIGQRSFSIGEITTLFLAYDNGDNGATTQKMSRTLTGYDEDKIGVIVSLSFDPNRDDKFSASILESADNLAKRNGSDIRTEMQKILSSIDIFSCSEDGAVLINVDQFIKNAMDNRTMGRAIAMMTPVETMPLCLKKRLAEGNGYVQQEEQEAAIKGKVSDDKKEVNRNKSAKEDKVEQEMNQMARETVLNIIENSDLVLSATGASDIKSAILEAETIGIQEEIEERFGVSFSDYKSLIFEGWINPSWIDCVYGKTA